MNLPLDDKAFANEETEKACLGSMLLVGETADLCRDIVKPEQFYYASHVTVCQAIYDLRAEGEGIDALVVAARLEQTGKLREELDYGRLIGLCDSVPHAGNATYYAREVVRWWRRRQIWRRACDLAHACKNFHRSEAELIGIASELIREASEEASTVSTLKDCVLDMLASLESEAQIGLKTGFYDLDDILGGLRPGTLTILGARPAVGKTSFLCNLVLNMGASGVFLASLEMPKADITERLAAMKAEVSIEAIRKRKMNQWQQEAIVTAANPLAEMPVFIDDKQGRTVEEIAAVCRTKQVNNPVGILMIDYLQLITPDNRRESREQQVAGIVKGLNRLAKELSIPVVALAQLNREIEKRENKRPRMSDLRESGQIEQGADAIVFLDRPATYDKSADVTEAKLIVEKNRHGEKRDISLVWDGPTMTFKNAAPKHLGGMEPDYWDNQ